MKKATLPNFENQNHGAGGGIPILKNMWEKFGFSHLFLSIDKHSGLSAWKLVFAYVSGLIANCSSVNKISEHCTKSPIIREILGGFSLSQSALSRFFSKDFEWQQSSINRLKTFCSASSETVISDGDVIALDDSKIEHPYGKKMPFLCWLFDNSEKKHLWCMNLVSTLLVRANGLVTPLSWKIWVQDKENKQQSKRTKLVLAQEMLLSLREVSQARLWVAMDRWFLCKDFFQWLNANGYDWVTKCKRNTALYQLSGSDWKGKPRYVPVNPGKLLAMVYNQLIGTGKAGEIASVSIPNIFIKLPEMIPNKKGIMVRKQVYTPIAAVATIRLPEDMDEERVAIDIADPDEKAAHFKGAYLLISNRVDAPEQAVISYAKRWKIEVFYRNAKQELGLTACHSQTKVAHEAHIEMIFIAETLLNYINWKLNKDGVITLTHGEMIREIINASHRVAYKNTLQLYFDTNCIKFASFIKNFWPKYYDLGFGRMPYHLLGATA